MSIVLVIPLRLKAVVEFYLKGEETTAQRLSLFTETEAEKTTTATMTTTTTIVNNYYGTTTITTTTTMSTLDGGLVIQHQKFQDGNAAGSYIGQSKDGKPHGKGKMVFANGDEYDGGWKDGKMHGEGVCEYANGSVYKGAWENGKMNGRGEVVFANGNKYEGEWKHGKKHGKGRWIWHNNGDEYDGEWKGDKMNGMGTFKGKDGMLFEGEYKDGIPQGRGLRKRADGSVEEFEWKGGKWNSCQSTNEDSDLVEIVSALSIEDVVAKKVQEAEAKGEVIEIE